MAQGLTARFPRLVNWAWDHVPFVMRCDQMNHPERDLTLHIHSVMGRVRYGLVHPPHQPERAQLVPKEKIIAVAEARSWLEALAKLDD